MISFVHYNAVAPRHVITTELLSDVDTWFINREVFNNLFITDYFVVGGTDGQRDKSLGAFVDLDHRANP
jgi:hypothetical protein